MNCANPHDYQNKKYHKLYTLSFIPIEYRQRSSKYDDFLQNEYNYPYVLKPYVCDSFSIGVKKIMNDKERDEDFNTYHKEFTMIEEYTEFDQEVGITYMKEKTGYSYKSCVKRNNHKHNIIDFGTDYITNIWNGDPCGILRNDLLTPDLVKILDHLGEQIPGNEVGRYDIKYRSDDDIKQGKDFVILEVNGGIGLDLRITTVSVYNLYDRFSCFMDWIGIRVLRGYQHRNLINHDQCIRMHYQYGMLILYHYILHLNLLSKFNFVIGAKPI